MDFKASNRRKATEREAEIRRGIGFQTVVTFQCPYGSLTASRQIGKINLSLSAPEKEPEEGIFAHGDFSGVLGFAAVPAREVESFEAKVEAQLEKDVEAGKFDRIAQRALGAYKKGEVTEL